MRKVVIFVVALAAIATIWLEPTKVSSTRDLAYEAYCDSIWESNPDYYMDVLAESDEYCTYIGTNGKWWAE